jgi:hypothetical protein
MIKDLIVNEVREAREKIAAECRYDYHQIYLRGQEIVKRWEGRMKVVSKEEIDQIRRSHRILH